MIIEKKTNWRKEKLESRVDAINVELERERREIEDDPREAGNFFSNLPGGVYRGSPVLASMLDVEQGYLNGMTIREFWNVMDRTVEEEGISIEAFSELQRRTKMDVSEEIDSSAALRKMGASIYVRLRKKGFSKESLKL